MKKVVGLPVRGDSFYDRKQELASIWGQLETEDILLLAPRRVGKTSLMLRLQDTADEFGFRAAYCSVAAATSESRFLNEIFKAIQKVDPRRRVVAALIKALDRFVKRVRKVGPVEFSDAAQEQWTTVGEQLTRQLAKAKARWLLLIDELPVFVIRLVKADDSLVRARAFLYWLRNLRQEPTTQDSVRWLLAGSIGLDTVTARLDLGDTINDLSLRSLGPFSKQVALRFLAELAASYDISLSAATRRHIVNRVGWPIPYYLQLIFSELLNLKRSKGSRFGKAAVDRVLDDLLRPEKKAYFDYWRQRLGQELGRPDGKLAIELLNSVAADPEGTTRRSLASLLSRRIQDPDQRDRKLRYLLDVLVGDGYIASAGGRYRFRSPLLREFWIRRVKL